MRQIVVVKVDNGTNINIVDDVKRPEEARTHAAENFKRLVGNNNYEITKKSKIVSHEEWKNERVSSNLSGNKLFKAMFYLNGSAQCLDVPAVSVKGVYNNIKIRYGIEDDLFMLIYDTTQICKKKSAVEEAKLLVNNKQQTMELFKEVAKKAMSTNMSDDNIEELKTAFKMIQSYQNGIYISLNINIIISVLTCLVYYFKPCEFDMDLQSGMANMSDEAVMIWLLNQLVIYVNAYNEWIKSKGKLKNAKSK